MREPRRAFVVKHSRSLDVKLLFIYFYSHAGIVYIVELTVSTLSKEKTLLELDPEVSELKRPSVCTV